jgi:hypothetical protein
VLVDDAVGIRAEEAADVRRRVELVGDERVAWCGSGAAEPAGRPLQVAGAPASGVPAMLKL